MPRIDKVPGKPSKIMQPAKARPMAKKQAPAKSAERMPAPPKKGTTKVKPAPMPGRTKGVPIPSGTKIGMPARKGK